MISQDRIVYCKSRILRMHFIFVHFVRGGFRTTTKCVLNVQSKSVRPWLQRMYAKFRTYEVFCIYNYYPGQKKLRQPSKLNYRRVHARESTRLRCAPAARGCLNFFGQGSSTCISEGRREWVITVPGTMLDTNESQSFNYAQGKTDTETNL